MPQKNRYYNFLCALHIINRVFMMLNWQGTAQPHRFAIHPSALHAPDGPHTYQAAPHVNRQHCHVPPRQMAESLLAHVHLLLQPMLIAGAYVKQQLAVGIHTHHAYAEISRITGYQVGVLFDCELI